MLWWLYVSIILRNKFKILSNVLYESAIHSTQGIFIFTLHVLRNNHVRKTTRVNLLNEVFTGSLLIIFCFSVDTFDNQETAYIHMCKRQQAQFYNQWNYSCMLYRSHIELNSKYWRFFFSVRHWVQVLQSFSNYSRLYYSWGGLTALNHTISIIFLVLSIFLPSSRSNPAIIRCFTSLDARTIKQLLSSSS